MVLASTSLAINECIPLLVVTFMISSAQYQLQTTFLLVPMEDVQSIAVRSKR